MVDKVVSVIAFMSQNWNKCDGFQVSRWLLFANMQQWQLSPSLQHTTPSLLISNWTGRSHRDVCCAENERSRNYLWLLLVSCHALIVPRYLLVGHLEMYPDEYNCHLSDCLFSLVSSAKDQPMHMFDAFTGALRASYCSYNHLVSLMVEFLRCMHYWYNSICICLAHKNVLFLILMHWEKFNLL